MPQMNADDVQKALDETTDKFERTAQTFFDMTWAERWKFLGEQALHILLVAVALIAVVVVGKWLIKKIDKLVDRIFVKRNIDTSINVFVRSLIKIIGWLIIIMIIISIVGIQTTSIAAVIAAAGFAIGMALSGTMQNFAGGIMILLLKPFRTGDYIQAQGYEGTVREIKLFSTVIRTSDNKTVIIPNGGLSTNIVNNFSSSGTRRAEWIINLGVGSDYDKAKQTLREILDKEPRVLESPPYFIALRSIDNAMISIVVRAWVKTGDFWDVFFDVNEKVYKIFPLRGLSIPSGGVSVTLSQQREAPVKPVKKTDAKTAEHEILSSSNDMKDSDNSVASMDDSHEKLHGIITEKLADRTPLIEENAESLSDEGEAPEGNS